MSREPRRSSRAPFFARFLEGQFPRVKSNLKAGKKPGGPTDPVLDMDQTHKFPSDSDEGEV
jgi:hypothetical protein